MELKVVYVEFPGRFIYRHQPDSDLFSFSIAAAL